MTDARVHMVVSGVVQGVGFRYFVARRAESRGLSGWVRNLFDGRVELVAEGERALLEELVHDVRIGPRAARVDDAVVTWELPVGLPAGFSIQ